MPITRALVITDVQRVELRDVPLIEPGPEDVVLRTAYTSISAGTERMLLAGRMPHPALSFPVVPGYETVGRVIGRGEQTPPELEGAWVYLGGARCFIGVNPAWGGQSQLLVADYRRVVPLERVEPRQGVLLALAATALHGVDLLGDLKGRRVLVLGQGPVGQLAARMARAQGAWVAVTEKVQSRLAQASADLVLNAQELPDELPGGPADVVIEATGSMMVLGGALGYLKQEGTILLLGYYDELRLPYMPLFLKQARLLTAREWAPGDLQRCRDLLASGALDAERLITHSLPVAQFEEGYRIALYDPDCLKLVLEWT